MELQLEADQLREQAARQNSIVSSLKKRIQVVPSPTIYILLFFLSLFILKLYYIYYSTNRIEKLAPRIITNFSLLLNRQKKNVQESEERERNLYAAQGRSEIALQGLQRDSRYHEEKVRECEKRIRQLEQEALDERESKERARSSFQVFHISLLNYQNLELN